MKFYLIAFLTVAFHNAYAAANEDNVDPIYKLQNDMKDMFERLSDRMRILESNVLLLINQQNSAAENHQKVLLNKLENITSQMDDKEGLLNCNGELMSNLRNISISEHNLIKATSEIKQLLNHQNTKTVCGNETTAFMEKFNTPKICYIPGPSDKKLKILLAESTVDYEMQASAVDFAVNAINNSKIEDSTEICIYIGRNMNEKYGKYWNCNVGKNFKFNRNVKNSIFFAIDDMYFRVRHLISEPDDSKKGNFAKSMRKLLESAIYQ